MNDDLVKRLLNEAGKDLSEAELHALCEEAAERIKQVEAELIRTHRLMMADAKRVEQLEAIMQKLVEPFKKALPLFGAQYVRSIRVGDQVVEELLAALEGRNMTDDDFCNDADEWKQIADS